MLIRSSITIDRRILGNSVMLDICLRIIRSGIVISLDYVDAK